MSHEMNKWEMSDLSQAMTNAITQNANPRFLRWESDKAKFNGFWREGDKQNICAWTNNATWHDAKTGEGGGCKEFAKIAFGMNLKEFMDRFGPNKNNESMRAGLDIAKIFKQAPDRTKERSKEYVDKLWSGLQKADAHKKDFASDWLANTRGIPNPRSYIGSGYINLTAEDVNLFDEDHKRFIESRVDKGKIIGVPLRDVHGEEVKNIFLRTITPIDKSEKSRLLTDCGGWGNLKDGLRAFGFPHLINEFPNLVICEGMADYFAAEYLLERSEKHLPIGAANADALVKWAQWISAQNYKGCVHFVYQLDTDNHGQLSAKEIGQAKAIEAARIIKAVGGKANIFPWSYFLENTTATPHLVKDLADSIQSEFETKQCGEGHLQFMFTQILDQRR